MGAYAARRLVWLPFLLIIVTFVTFALLRFGPGDPVQVWLGQHQNDEVRARLRAQLGLDDPLVVQYVHYVEGVVTRLDFGESFQFRGKSVARVAGQAHSGIAAAEPGCHHHHAGGWHPCRSFRGVTPRHGRGQRGGGDCAGVPVAARIYHRAGAAARVCFVPGHPANAADGAGSFRRRL